MKSILTLLICCLSLAAQAATWQYRVVDLYLLHEENQLNDLGKHGWELVAQLNRTIVLDSDQAGPRYIFKRIDEGKPIIHDGDLSLWLGVPNLIRQLYKFRINAKIDDGIPKVWVDEASWNDPVKKRAIQILPNKDFKSIEVFAFDGPRMGDKKLGTVEWKEK